jgi:hypothetical protein
MRWNPLRHLVFATGIVVLAGCAPFGPRSLRADQVDYGRALGDARKREILSMIVGLRYADAPAFLNVSQIIAAYTFTATGTAIGNSTPDPGGPALGGMGVLSYANHPTFTFTPTTGEDYAHAYIHPLSPALFMPLADGGIPIDLLLRITVQSIGGLNNATMLGGPSGSGSAGFFELLPILRRLQLAGELSVDFKKGSGNSEVMLNLGIQQGGEPPQNAADVARARALLHLSGPERSYEIVSGSANAGNAQVSVESRSVLAILSSLGAEIKVPPRDVDSGATKPAIELVGGETRPIVIIHSGKQPGSVYAAVSYHSEQFWIDDADFDSKYALQVVQDLMALAEITDTSHAPVVTVPAG